MSDSVQANEELWSLQRIQDYFSGSSDVIIESYQIQEYAPASQIVLTFAIGLCDTVEIGKTVLPALKRLYNETQFNGGQHSNMMSTLPLLPIETSHIAGQFAESVFEGDLVLFIPKTNAFYKLSIANTPKRTPGESKTEISIKGPRDGFVEDIVINVALIRKRIRSNSLCHETLVLGRRTKTKIGVLYINDLIQPSMIQEVRKRLKDIDIDGIYSIGQLEEMIVDSKYSIFPLIDFTGRPDYVINALLNGRFIIVVDGNPMVLVGPATLSLLMKSPEDIHFNFLYISFVRIIRVISLFLSILLPGLWVALSAFHQDQVPFRLLATIGVSRQGLPFSPQMELFVLLLLLEIFREAGLRLPSSIGQTLTVIGGLIIGDAAIRAGLVSPSVVVVGAITAVSGATLVNQSLSSALSVIRFLLFFAASFLGMYGLILGFILLAIYVSRLRSFGNTFVEPLSNRPIADVLKSLIRLPWKLMIRRPARYNTIDNDHQGEDTA
ncbi:spore germination protein [Paenibacillus selenitireducens]|uniref:Spore germination protein n=1 Tax=Paenibacillus selenitireducens TaxID=1324314 RepID=A0A1T2X5Z2_9BACL|nr:spore germination protein [Paenibacillus selenitireducens]OPA75297.1 spore germination protein [Paenibacillus selenitireducens]